MKEYRLTVKNQLLNNWPILLVGLLCGIYPFYMALRYPHHYSAFTMIAGGVFIIFLIPQLILHIQYLRASKNIGFYINYEHQTICIKTADEEKSYRFGEIKKIIRTRTFNFASKNMYWSNWDIFNYTIFQMIDGEAYVITSYVCYDFQITHSLPNAVYKKVIYPYIEKKYNDSR